MASTTSATQESPNAKVESPTQGDCKTEALGRGELKQSFKYPDVPPERSPTRGQGTKSTRRMYLQDGPQHTSSREVTVRSFNRSGSNISTENASKAAMTKADFPMENALENAASTASKLVTNIKDNPDVAVAQGKYPKGLTKEDREFEFQEMLRRIDRDAAAAKAVQSSGPSSASLDSPMKPMTPDEPLVSLTDETDADAFDLLPSFSEALPKP